MGKSLDLRNRLAILGLFGLGLGGEQIAARRPVDDNSALEPAFAEKLRFLLLLRKNLTSVCGKGYVLRGRTMVRGTQDTL